MLQIPKDVWHYRVYEWTKWNWFKFWRPDIYKRYHKNLLAPHEKEKIPNFEATNVCEYMRTLLVKLPILLAMHVSLACVLVFVLIWFPTNHFGLMGIGQIALWTFSFVIAFMVLFFLLTLIVYANESLRNEAKWNHGSVGIIYIWIKNKFCPIIKFENNKDDHEN